MDNIVSINNLKKFYDNGETKALNGINLDIRRGEFVSIIGPSGSGKSTLLNMIGALDTPDSGSIVVDGVDLNNRKENFSRFRSRKIGFIFQLHNLIPNLNVLENVLIPVLGRKGRVNKDMRSRAESLLGSVGLEEKLKQNPTKMSGGQRQRVAICRALINNPSIIIADEPTGALDTKTSAMIMDLLKRLHVEKNVTLIVVTHDPSVASQADRIITVRDGRIIEGDDSVEDSGVVSGDSDEVYSFVDFVESDDNVFGTDSRKLVQFRMDGKLMEVMIRPLSSSEFSQTRLKEEDGVATFQELLVAMACYSRSGGQLSLELVKSRLSAGVVDELARNIIDFSRYGFK